MRRVIKALRRYNEATLSKKRYAHVRRVRKTAMTLADRFDVDVDAVETAALAHDMDRETAPDELVRLVERHGIAADAADFEKPVLLHGPVAAWRLEREFGVFEPSVLDAVRYHTFGRTALDAVGHVIFAADYLEPGRPYLSEPERDTMTASDSLAAVVCAVIDHNRSRYGSLDTRTTAMYQELTEKLTWRA